MAAPRNPWIVPLSQPDRPSFQAFCVPAVGGGAASFQSWKGVVPDSLAASALRLPGRESRLHEPAIDDRDELVGAVVDALAERLDLPYALIGDCSGALIALDLAREIDRRRMPRPLALFGASCPAPQLPRVPQRLHTLPSEEMVGEVAALGGVPDELLSDPELVELVAPAIRADLRIAETWTHRPAEPLAPAICMLGGTDDALIRPEDLLPWRQHTTGPFSLRLLPGGHFVLTTEPVVVTRLIASDLDALGADGGL